MTTIVSVSDLRRHFKAMLDRVSRSKQVLILTRDSQPQAALIPYEDFVRYQQFEKAKVLERFDQLLRRMAQLNSAFSDEEVEADLQALDRERLEKNAPGSR